MIKIQTMEELNEQISLNEKFLLFKHSSTCSVSMRAFQEIQTCVQTGKIPICYLIVQENRALSKEIALKFQVIHESPQVMIIHRSKVIWHASHFNVEAKQILKQI